MTVRAALLAALLVAGCDAAEPPPEPPAPAGEAPTGLRMTTADPMRIGLAWTDRSDDETAFRVEVATRPFLDRPDGPDVFRALATLPPGSTAFMDDSLRDVSARLYRVVAVGAEGGADAVSETLAVEFPVHRTRLSGLAGREIQSVSSSGGYSDLLVVGVTPSEVIGYDWDTGQRVGEIADATAVLGPAAVLSGGYSIAEPAATPHGSSVWVRERFFDGGPSFESFILELDPATGCTHTTISDLTTGLGGLVGRCGNQGVVWLSGSIRQDRYLLRPGDRILGGPVVNFPDQTLLIASTDEPTRLVDFGTGEVLWQRSRLARQSHFASHNSYVTLLVEATADGVDVVDPRTGDVLERIDLAPATVRLLTAVAYGRFLAYSVESDPWIVEAGQVGRPHERVRIPLREGHTISVQNRRLIEFVHNDGAPELWGWRLDESWQTVALP